jgi:hypothetical protein
MLSSTHPRVLEARGCQVVVVQVVAEGLMLSRASGVAVPLPLKPQLAQRDAWRQRLSW